MWKTFVHILGFASEYVFQVKTQIRKFGTIAILPITPRKRKKNFFFNDLYLLVLKHPIKRISF